MGPSQSKEWSDLLDKFGYTDQGMKEQIVTYTKESVAMDHGLRELLKGIEFLYVGSRIEGTALHGFSDIDTLQVLSEIQCVEIDPHQTPKHTLVCWFIQGDTPGHGFVRVDYNKHMFENAMFVRWKNEIYLSSRKIMEDKIKGITKAFENDKRHIVGMPRGPSTPILIRYNRVETWLGLGDLDMTMDNTLAIPFHCPTTLAIWRERPRQFDWPTNETIQKVVALPGFLVPVAHSGTERTDLQWRICFNLAETILVHSLNNTHKKLYLTLKLIRQCIFKDMCNYVTSFMLKNVVFWLAETTPIAEFVPEKLEERVHDALVMLRDSLIDGRLKFFMIPERCLFDGKIPTEQRKILVVLIDLVLDDQTDLLNGVNLKNIMTKLMKCYVLERQRFCQSALFTPDQLSIYIRDTFDSKMSGLSAMWDYLSNIIKVGIPCVYKYGFRFMWNCLSIEHEKIVEGCVTIDDYKRYACEHCQNSLSVHPNESGKRKREEKPGNVSGEGSKRIRVA